MTTEPLTEREQQRLEHMRKAQEAIEALLPRNLKTIRPS